MPREISRQLSVLFLVLISFLFFPGFFKSWLPPGQKCWQAILQIKFEGESYLSSGLSDRLKVMAEAEWHGFLEEDGLDFIIYYLASYLNKCEFWPEKSEKREYRLKSLPLVPPDFRVDYVEGLEKEIRFYYSFRPPEITWPGEDASVSFKVLLPSAPWPFKKDPRPDMILKTTGSRIVTVERTALEKPVVQREFFWQAEVYDRYLQQKREIFSTWLKLFLKRLSS